MSCEIDYEYTNIEKSVLSLCIVTYILDYLADVVLAVVDNSATVTFIITLNSLDKRNISHELFFYQSKIVAKLHITNYICLSSVKIKQKT